MMLRKTLAARVEISGETGASMRPQHDAAENAQRACRQCNSARASMRPQHDAAENDLFLDGRSPSDDRFNEAAA